MWSGFAKRSAKEPKYKGMTGILAAIVVVVGLVFFVLGYYFLSLRKLPSEAVVGLGHVYSVGVLLYAGFGFYHLQPALL